MKDNLEDIAIEFIRQLRVNGDQLPKRNTIEMYKSFLKKFILIETKMDVTNEIQFEKFGRAYKTYLRTLKSAGRGDTDHHCEISEKDLGKIYKIFLR